MRSLSRMCARETHMGSNEIYQRTAACGAVHLTGYRFGVRGREVFAVLHQTAGGGGMRRSGLYCRFRASRGTSLLDRDGSARWHNDAPGLRPCNRTSASGICEAARSRNPGCSKGRIGRRGNFFGVQASSLRSGWVRRQILLSSCLWASCGHAWHWSSRKSRGSAMARDRSGIRHRVPIRLWASPGVESLPTYSP